MLPLDSELSLDLGPIITQMFVALFALIQDNLQVILNVVGVLIGVSLGLLLVFKVLKKPTLAGK
ncbi:MAG: hypothetical protein LBN10_02990 [Propionibacteriaceae bacterium]|nr:hypothetical protein [Propionibacteriaceae bacterium]